MQHTSYVTKGGIRVRREVESRVYGPADNALADALDSRRGVLFSSSFEFPGRYTRWDMGFVDPPLVFTARGRGFSLEALNQRGRVLLPAVAEHARRPRRGRRFGPRATTASPAKSTKARSASRKSSAAGSLRCSRCCGRWSICSAAPRTSISGSTAPSATIWCFSSSRCGCGCRAPTISATSCSICRTRSWSSTTCAQVCGDPPLRVRGRRPVDRAVCRARPRRLPIVSTAPLRRGRGERPRPGRICRAGRAGAGRPSRAAICSRSWSASSSPMPAPTRRAWSFSGCGRPTRRPTAR